ncbi:ATP-binding protein [Mucilaginibacter sp. CAU 1740]|uniref:ATP-binding protein n=1 Tax=Mucilaginibacter sp. CAU 1740 TaxID=3140365 RepID=UPI00325B7A8B
MELLLGYEILDSYQRLPYKIWYALAEFIDNSIQSYRNHPELKDILKGEGIGLFVNISYQNKTATNPGFISIVDNAWGMDEQQLQNALILGKKPEVKDGLSKYGLGLKTAAFWFGRAWTIETTEYGSAKKLIVEVDLNKILKEEEAFYEKQRLENPNVEALIQFKPNLEIKKVDCDVSSHGTRIHITDLYRKFIATTVSTCREYLSSIYRKDLESKSVEINFQGEALRWSMEEILSRLALDDSRARLHRSFSFVINGKNVYGWAGVLQNGGRKYAGFSLLQANRVIQGFPMAYKPRSIFGEDGGRNDLINQRLVGELHVDGFEVSHTKDQILFDEEEEVALEENLIREIGDFKKLASKLRVKEIESRPTINFELATSHVLKNLKTKDFQYTLFQKDVLPEEVIESSNDEAVRRVSRVEHKSLIAKIGQLEILVLMSDESSVFDPYLIVQARSDRDKLTIVINKNHSYWSELDESSAFNFLLNCIYDGIAEWKAFFIVESIDPSTIKLIKDHFLRLRLDILD